MREQNILLSVQRDSHRHRGEKFSFLLLRNVCIAEPSLDGVVFYGQIKDKTKKVISISADIPSQRMVLTAAR